MEALTQDLRFALRGLLRSPGFTAAAVASLALGIGANTLIFTFVNALFLTPLPVAEPGRLVAIYSQDVHNPELLPFSYLNFADLRRAASSVLAGAAASFEVSLSLSGGGEEPSLVFGQMVSGNYFDVLGLRPFRGRFFLPEDDRVPGALEVCVVSHGLWQRRFGNDPGLLGRPLRINGHSFTVVGVAPPRFKGLAMLAQPPELWVPLGTYGELLTAQGAKNFDHRDALILGVVARLGRAATIERARAVLSTTAHQLERRAPAENKDLAIAALPLQQTTIAPAQRGKYVRSGSLLAAMVGLLLLVAGANVANLLLARALGRSREISMRLALGASRGRLARQLLVEGALLGLLGGAVGLVAAAWGRGLLWALRPPFFPDTVELALDGRVLAFTLGVALITGLLFSLAPIGQSLRLEITPALTQQPGSPRRGTFAAVARQVMVATQTALALVVLIGAGLFLRSLAAAEQIDPGFESEKLFVIPFNLGAQGYAPPAVQEFYRRAVERTRGLPGVRSAAVATRFVLIEGGQRFNVEVEGQAGRQDLAKIQVGLNRVGLGYFETVGIPLRSGRAFTGDDRPGGRLVAVVNEALARRLWPGEAALGKRFRFAGERGFLEVAGVAGDARNGALGDAPEPFAYLPIAQSAASIAMLHVRTDGDPLAAVPAVRREVQGLDPNLPLLDAHTVGQVRSRALWAPRMGAGLLSLFGLLALALAALGMYGVLAYSIGQRRREIGVRMAIGARPPDVIGLVVRQGMLPVLWGAAAGLAAGLAGARLIRSLLFGVGAADPAALAGATLLLLAVALAAAYVPARRAAALDPTSALRTG
ncbi:MAG TPA: ABC transporter permease [Thermoanaerobaculia bacterium]|nr:ABC transporter permease [Thermoanaerobaculia bacterium]